MTERKKRTGCATLWVKPSTHDMVNRKKKKGETFDECVRRYFRG